MYFKQFLIITICIVTIGYGSSQSYYSSSSVRRRDSLSAYGQRGYQRNSLQPATRQQYNRNFNTYSNSYSPSRATNSNRNFLTNNYNDNYISNNKRSRQYRIKKADAENAKFAGLNNLENDNVGSGKTLLHKKRKLLQLKQYASNPCYPYGRDAGAVPKEQGRFLFDVNVYNVYQRGPQNLGCNYGYGGGLGGLGGLGGFGAGSYLSDPLYPAAVYPNRVGQFLSLFAPGILQNSLAATRPPPLADPAFQNNDSNNNSNNNDSLQDDEIDPDVDPTYRPPVAPVRRPPNRVYYDSSGAVCTNLNGYAKTLD